MSQHTYARALTIAIDTGASEAQARELFARLHASGIHLIEIEPDPEPYTGERAKPQQELLEETRARIADAQAAVKRAENEHFDQIRKQVKG